MIAGTAIRNRVGWPALHLKGRGELCEQCGASNADCPMNLDVMDRVLRGDLYHSECIMCGSCISACLQRVIGYSL